MQSAFTPSTESRVAVTKIPCLLFDDQVTERLCSLRRDELHGKGVFSCKGCIRNEQILSANPPCRLEQRLPDALAR